MKALLIGEGWPPDTPGGLNRYLRSLLEHLPDVGVSARAVVVGPASDAPPRVRSADRGSMTSRLTAVTRLVSQAASQADVIDVHFAMYGYLPTMLPAVRNKPIVAHFHGPWAAESLAGGEGELSSRIKRSVERSVFRRADRYIVLSDAFAETLSGYGVRPEAIRKVRPGVDIERFVALPLETRWRERRRLGVAANGPLVVSVRRLVPRMGLDVLLKAWAKASQKHPDATLAIVGDGSERGHLQALSIELGLSSVIFTGRVDESSLSAWYSAADLAVTPSTSLEGFGLVLLEALASGTPVLASDIGGMREAIGALGPNHLVPAGDIDSWCDALEGYLSGSRQLASREEARDFAEASTWTATAAQVKEVYEEAMAPPRHRGPNS